MRIVVLAVSLFAIAMSLSPPTAAAEPSLQVVFDAYFGAGQVPVAVFPQTGTPNPFADTLTETFPPGRYEFTVIARCAGLNATIGWYPAGNTETQTTVYSDEAGRGTECINPLTPASFAVDIPVQFGVFMQAGLNTFRSETRFNGDETDHFVVYAGPAARGGFAIGIEDVPSTVGFDGDYQDAVLFIARVNQPPFFDAIADQYVNPPATVPQTLTITGVVPGPASEVAAGQTVGVSAVSSNTALIPNPTITPPGEGNPDWTLTYVRPTNASGQATITVTATDSGGIANGGTNTFTRAFDIVIGSGPSTAVNATITNLNVGAGPLVTVTITAGPIDFDGNGTPDCYRFFRPRPAPEEPYNVIPSNADQTPEAPVWSIPADTEEICTQTKTFTAVLDLSKWITTPGTTHTDIAYVSIVRDPQCPPACPFGPIWTGVKPAGSVTFTTGDTVAVKATVTLNTLDTVTKKTTSTRLPDVPVRDFDIRNHDFLVVAGDAVKTTRGSPDPTINLTRLSTILGKIYEADKGRIGSCTTDATGVCFASQAAPAYDLVVVKFFDAATGKTVYVADVKRPVEFVGGIAVSNITITKMFKNGVFQRYAPGSLVDIE